MNRRIRDMTDEEFDGHLDAINRHGHMADIVIAVLLVAVVAWLVILTRVSAT